MPVAFYTAIPYRASTGPEQGFPCVVFPHREKPVFISWEPCNENRFFPDGNTTQGKPCSHYRGGVCSVHMTTLKSLIDEQIGINKQAWKKVPPRSLIYKVNY